MRSPLSLGLGVFVQRNVSGVITWQLILTTFQRGLNADMMNHFFRGNFGCVSFENLVGTLQNSSKDLFFFFFLIRSHISCNFFLAYAILLSQFSDNECKSTRY